MSRTHSQSRQQRFGSGNLAIIGLVSTVMVLWLSGSFWYEAYLLRKDAVRLNQGLAFEHTLFELSASLAHERSELFAVQSGNASSEPVDIKINVLLNQLNSLDKGSSLVLDSLRNRIELLRYHYRLLWQERAVLKESAVSSASAPAQDATTGNTFKKKLVLFERYSNLSTQLVTILTAAQINFLPRRNDTEVAGARNLQSLVWSLKAETIELDSLLDREIRLREMISADRYPARTNSDTGLAMGEIERRYQQIDSAIERLDNDGHLLGINDVAIAQLGLLADWHTNRYQPAVARVLSPSIGNAPHNSLQQEWAQVCSERMDIYGKLWAQASGHFQGVADGVTAKANRNLFIDTVLLFLSLLMGLRIFSAIQKMKYQADHDELTRLPNRRKFSELLHEEIAIADSGGHKLALVIMDLNKFDIINDTLGHAVGEGVLKTIAFRLLEFKSDTVSPARFGGDEFTAAVKCKDQKEAVEIAQQLREVVKKEIEYR